MDTCLDPGARMQPPADIDPRPAGAAPGGPERARLEAAGHEPGALGPGGPDPGGPDPGGIDAAVLAAAVRGDAAAVTAIWHAHAGAVLGTALRVLGRRDAAEDVLQDVFMKALGRLGDVHSPAALRPWLRRLAANAAIDRLRQERRFLDEDAAAEPVAPAAPTADVVEALGLMARLPDGVRAVLWLHVAEGWTHAELAARFGRSESWSKSLVSRAQARLRHLMEDAP